MAQAQASSFPTVMVPVIQEVVDAVKKGMTALDNLAAINANTTKMVEGFTSMKQTLENIDYTTRTVDSRTSWLMGAVVLFGVASVVGQLYLVKRTNDLEKVSHWHADKTITILDYTLGDEARRKQVQQRSDEFLKQVRQ